MNPTHAKLQSLALSLLLACGGALAQSDAGKAARFYEDALKRYEKHDHAGAIVQLKNVLQIDKNQLAARVLMGKALLGSGEAANAEVEFNEALRLGANRAEVVVQLALALSVQGKQAQMFDDPRFNPAGLPAQVQLQLLLVRAAAQADTGDTKAALKSVEDARQLDPLSIDSWLAEVPIRIRSRQFKEAIAAADQALKIKADSPAALYQKGSVLHVQGNAREALALYERAIKLDEAHLEARLARAGILLDLNRDSDAAKEVEALLGMAPNEPRAIFLRAQLAERAGDMERAKASLKRITELLDGVPIEAIRFRHQALILNGMAHFGLNEMAKAKPYLEYAVRQQPYSPLSKLLAQAYMAEPAMVRAEELLETYLKARPGDGQAMLMLASAQMSLGRHAKATALLQTALRAKEAPEFRTALGLSLLRGGQAVSAMAELEKAFKADPKQFYAGLALVSVYLRSNQLSKAQIVADQLVKSNPNNTSALMLLGTTKLQARDFNGARSAYELALKATPDLTEARLGLVQVDIASKAYDSAGKRLKEILKGNERNVDALLEMAVLTELTGKKDDALKWLESAVEASNQRETRANFALVTWHLRLGQPAKAMDAAKLLLAKLPDDAEAAQLYAQAQLANNDLAGARSTLNNASRRAGFDAPTQVAIARAQIQAQDLPGAAYSLDKALTSNKDDLDALMLMTIVDLRQGDTAKAERRARQIVQEHPKLALGHNLLADVAIRRGQSAAAIESLRRAHELEKSSQTMLRLLGLLAQQDGGKPAIATAETWLKSYPKDVAVHKALGDSLARAGNFKAARRSYETALALRPDDIEALNNLANTLMRLEDPGALKVAEQALARDPHDPLLIDTAGWANHLAGNRDRALLLMRDARLRAPGNPDIRYHLAGVLAQAGRKAEAKTELEAALQGKRVFENLQDAKNLMLTLK